MDSLFTQFFLEPSKAAPLLEALKAKNYPAIYAALRKLEQPLDGPDAFLACFHALDCTTRAFQSVLEHCAPHTLNHYQDLCGYFLNPSIPGSPWDLVEAAAYLDKPEALDLLLKQGYGPNKSPGCTYSPIEAAILGRSMKCVQRLLQEPELDTTVTETLLSQWAQVEQEDTLLDWCCQLLCDRFLGKAYSPFDPIPLPDGLTVTHAAQAENWPFVIRLCRERPVTPKDGSAALSHILLCSCHSLCMPDPFSDLLTDNPSTPDLAALAPLYPPTAALLEACPGLLRREVPRRLLVLLALAAPDGVPPELSPWLERMPGRLVVLDPTHDIPLFADLLPERWNERLGNRLSPALRRSGSFFGDISKLARCLPHCQIIGRPPKGAISQLAAIALELLPIQELAAQLHPGGLLDGEDPALLLQALEDGNSVLDKRAALLAHTVRKDKEDPYAL